MGFTVEYSDTTRSPLDLLQEQSIGKPANHDEDLHEFFAPATHGASSKLQPIRNFYKNHRNASKIIPLIDRMVSIVYERCSLLTTRKSNRTTDQSTLHCDPKDYANEPNEP